MISLTEFKKKLLFIKYLFSHANLRSKRIDNEPTPLLIDLKNVIPIKSSSLWDRFREKMTRDAWIYNIWATAAYIKTSLFYQPTYLISNPLKLIYVRVPKAASTFIAYEIMKKLEPSLPSSLDDKEVNQISPYLAKRYIPLEQRNFTSFSVVRNPFHRIVAVHREFFSSDPTKNFIYENYLFGILKRDMDFKKFIEVIDLIPDFLKDRHFKPQSFVLKQVKKKTKIKIFKLEEHSNELRAFLNSYDLSMPQQKESSKSYDYQSYYDMETAQKVRSIYIDDITDFNYENIWNDLINALKKESS